MAIGYDQPLYLMPFDHRESLQTKMFGWYGTLSVRQTAEIAAAKQVIYDGFLAAVRDGVPKEHAGILVDEQFGADIRAMPPNTVTRSPAPSKRAGKRSLSSSTGRTSPATSRRSIRRSARCSCGTTRKATPS